jgi:hypothetical protein
MATPKQAALSPQPASQRAAYAWLLNRLFSQAAPPLTPLPPRPPQTPKPAPRPQQVEAA